MVLRFKVVNRDLNSFMQSLHFNSVRLAVTFNFKGENLNKIPFILLMQSQHNFLGGTNSLNLVLVYSPVTINSRQERYNNNTQKMNKTLK